MRENNSFVDISHDGKNWQLNISLPTGDSYSLPLLPEQKEELQDAGIPIYEGE